MSIWIFLSWKPCKFGFELIVLLINYVGNRKIKLKFEDIEAIIIQYLF